MVDGVAAIELVAAGAVAERGWARPHLNRSDNTVGGTVNHANAALLRIRAIQLIMLADKQGTTDGRAGIDALDTLKAAPIAPIQHHDV